MSLAAKQLGGDRRAQILTVVVAATIPMGIMQASSTQNDYVVAFWLVWLGQQCEPQSSPDDERPAGQPCPGPLTIEAKDKDDQFMVWMTLARSRRDGVQAWRALTGDPGGVALNAGHYGRNLGRLRLPWVPAPRPPGVSMRRSTCRPSSPSPCATWSCTSAP